MRRGPGGLHPQDRRGDRQLRQPPGLASSAAASSRRPAPNSARPSATRTMAKPREAGSVSSSTAAPGVGDRALDAAGPGLFDGGADRGRRGGHAVPPVQRRGVGVSGSAASSQPRTRSACPVIAAVPAIAMHSTGRPARRPGPAGPQLAEGRGGTVDHEPAHRCRPAARPPPAGRRPRSGAGRRPRAVRARGTSRRRGPAARLAASGPAASSRRRSTSRKQLVAAEPVALRVERGHEHAAARSSSASTRGGSGSAQHARRTAGRSAGPAPSRPTSSSRCSAASRSSTSATKKSSTCRSSPRSASARRVRVRRLAHRQRGELQPGRPALGARPPRRRSRRRDQPGHPGRGHQRGGLVGGTAGPRRASRSARRGPASGPAAAAGRLAAGDHQVQRRGR